MFVYEVEVGKLLKDLWVACNDYIQVFLDCNDNLVDVFVRVYVKKSLDEEVLI